MRQTRRKNGSYVVWVGGGGEMTRLGDGKGG